MVAKPKSFLIPTNLVGDTAYWGNSFYLSFYNHWFWLLKAVSSSHWLMARERDTHKSGPRLNCGFQNVCLCCWSENTDFSWYGGKQFSRHFSRNWDTFFPNKGVWGPRKTWEPLLTFSGQMKALWTFFCWKVCINAVVFVVCCFVWLGISTGSESLGGLINGFGKICLW